VRTSTQAYATERVKQATAPVYFIRFFHVPQYGALSDYAFSVDFATAAVASPSVSKLLYLGRLQGNQAQIAPWSGHADYGQFVISLIDASGAILKYLATPALTVKTTMTSGSPGVGGFVELNEAIDGLPAAPCTIAITTAGVIERIRYDQVDLAGKRVRVLARGVDGTTAASHGIGDAATNGEQIRRGQRVQIYCGYDVLAELDYMKLVKMEVTDRKLSGDGVTFEITASDIHRTTRRSVFLSATTASPVILTGNQLTLALQILTSTGAGTNGAYDVLAAQNGLAIPTGFIDIKAIEALRDSEFPAEVFSFAIKAAVDAGSFLESEILKPSNCYPIVLQDGRLSFRRFPCSSYRDSVMATGPFAYWRLGEPTGTTAYDCGGNQVYNGTYAGGPTLAAPALIVGDTNAAVTFDGVNDAMTTPAVGTLGALSFECWFKKASAPATESAIVERATAVNDFTRQQAMRIDTAGKVKLILKNGTPAQDVSLVSSISVCDGLPHYLVCTHDGVSVQKIYIDGVERASGSTTHGANSLTTAFFVGKTYATSPVFLAMTLDELALYAGAMTTSVGRHYDAGSGATLLNADSIIRRQWSEAPIINAVELDYDWDLGSAPGVFSATQLYAASASLAKYGRQDPVSIPSQGIKTGNGGQAIADDRALQLVKWFAEPAPVLNVEAFYSRHILEPGDVVTVTDPLTPNPKTGLRGLTNEFFMVVNGALGLGAEGKMTFSLLWVGGLVTSPAPVSGGALVPGSPYVDATPPSVPVGLSLNTGNTLDGDGTVRVFLEATWAENVEADLSGYDLQYKRTTDAAWTSVTVPKGQMPYRTFEVLGVTSYDARVRARDFSGNVSGFTAIQTLTTAGDITAPAAPSGVLGSGSFTGAVLSWNAIPDADFDVVEIWRSTANDRTTATLVGREPGTTFIDSGLKILTTYYYWLRSVDFSKNASAFHAADNNGLALTTTGNVGFKLTLVTKVFSGTFINDLSAAALVFDALGSEIDWFVRVSGDLDYGEVTQNGAVHTALGLKFTGETKIQAAFDGTNEQLAIINAGVVKYAKADHTGSVLTSPTTKFSPAASNVYQRACPAVKAGGTEVYYAIQNDDSPFTTSKLRFAKTDLSGTVTLAAVDVGTTGSSYPSEDVRIGVDSDGNAHIFYKQATTTAFQEDAFQNDAFQTDSPQPMKYVKVNTNGNVLIASSSPLTPPPGANDISPAAVLVDSHDIIHVIGYTYIGTGLMFSYGRMKKDGTVIVPMTIFYSTPTDVKLGLGAIDTLLNQIYVGWISTTGVNQLRLDPIDPTGQTLDFTMPRASL
jgi:hypothetical protein